MHKGRRVSRNYVYNIEHNNAERLGFHNPDGLLIEKIHAALLSALVHYSLTQGWDVKGVQAGLEGGCGQGCCGYL